VHWTYGEDRLGANYGLLNILFLEVLSFDYIVKGVFSDHTFDDTWDRNDGNVLGSEVYCPMWRQWNILLLTVLYKSHSKEKIVSSILFLLDELVVNRTTLRRHHDVGDLTNVLIIFHSKCIFLEQWLCGERCLQTKWMLNARFWR
jgi:hypothetical protein